MSSIATIPLSLPFADTLAEWVVKEYGEDPLTLSSITLLLPSRRAARAMREAFLRVSGGKPLLLPSMRGLGDVEEDEANLWESDAVPPAISPLRRQLILSDIIQAWADTNSEKPISREQAMQLAYDLAAFLDETQRYELSLDNLKNIVPDDLAQHWQVTLDFFDVLAKEWLRRLKALGLIDPITRRNMLLDAQAQEWREHPPKYPVIAAGTTGSTPATFRLLKTIMELPKGMVVLPALDKTMPDTVWNTLEEHHPQFAVKQLLEGLRARREDICELSPSSMNTREALLSAVMAPAGAETGDVSLGNITRIDAPIIRQEAEAIALMLRDALETSGRRAALVTTDRELAGRVVSLMERWGIAIDDSAGRAMADTPPVAFLQLVADMVESRFAPAPLLAALKHPLATGGMEPGVFRHKVRELELAVLRGLRPAPGLEGLRAALREKEEPLEFLGLLEKMMAEFSRYFTVTPDAGICRHDIHTLLSAHIACAEALAPQLWESDAGGQAFQWLENLQDAVEDSAPLYPAEYAGWFGTLWLGRKFRPAYGTHPRLAILSPMEARLQRFDRMVLGGMNEGSWPSVRADAWMNRQMRTAFGLPSEAFYTGLSARDFVECCAAPEVVLTRSQKSGGKPAIASPWLLRLDAVLQAKGLALPETPWLAYAEMLHKPEREEKLRPPHPTPPVSARPKKLSVTEVEKWMRDPYAIYAKKILGLKKLDAIDQDPEMRDYGTLLHGIFEEFIRKVYAEPAPARESWPALLLSIGEKHFLACDTMPAIRKLWWPRFERIAAWFVEAEGERHVEVMKILPENRMQMQFGSVTLTAKSDRVEMLKDGSLRIADYKTGVPPTMADVARGLASQLTLTALIAEAEGKEVSALEYWRLSATEPETCNAIDLKKTTVEQVKQDTKEGFTRLLAAFADQATPYLACPGGEKSVKYNDYAHLERVREWSIGEQE